ncbi:MAG: GNAT family N-acetyltransferase [Nitrososphaerales archaeon]
MPVLLRGERIRIRPLETEEDLRYLFQTFNNHESSGKLVNFEPRSWEHFQNFIKEEFKSPAQFTSMLIEKLADKQLIGLVVHFVPHPLGKSCLEIGYGINDPALRKKGYASEAGRLFVDFLFTTKPLERLQATVNIENIGSQEVLKKLGFAREGILRKTDFVNAHFTDTIMFSLLREEWENRKAA